MLRIFGPKRKDVIGDCRNLNEELHDLYSSPNIRRIIKSRRKSLGGYVAHVTEITNAYKFQSEFQRNRVEGYGLDSSGT
jgi:hypothetical protein